ncbi:hypothetical protein ANO14919_130750 [Xylariales sp. No.14919]|nr:hypothetical protein ANO14919_130750 [Xylariales sp. No.14919]
MAVYVLKASRCALKIASSRRLSFFSAEKITLIWISIFQPTQIKISSGFITTCELIPHPHRLIGIDEFAFRDALDP